ncbi:exporter of polyketide antibiotics [Georgenia halophila]|uniref:Exporter of polyketide antibiotics n=1 Tax=Georgenia halophila TaxID=620889 RepID=A0ABP8LCL3_9MICO
MTAATQAPDRPVHEGTSGSQPWASTGALLRVFLRLDRLRIVIWTLAVGLLTAGSVDALDAAYAGPEALQARAELLENPSAVMMTGPAFGMDNYTFGAMVANELSLYLFLSTAIMSVLIAIRHTRAEEESGRMEILRALPVGRYAAPTATLVTVALANLAVGVGIALGLVGTGMETASSLAMALASALTGLLFGAVAAVTAQLTEHARAASGAALGVLAVAFLVRGIGDVMETGGSWLSWFSPLAWGQQTRLYVDLRWWPLALTAVATAALLVVAVALSQRRDLGAGLRPPSPGPATAKPALRTPAGLARRLLETGFLAWTIGLALFSVAFGALANSLEDMIDQVPEMGGFISGDLLEDLTTGFTAFIVALMVLPAAALAVAGVLRLRSEESEGRVEALAVTGSSRPGLLGGWLATVATQAVISTAVFGLSVGLGVAAATGDGTWVWRAALAALSYLPAVALTAAVAVALYGLVPRAAGLAWILVVWAFFAMYFGDLLDLPEWARAVSPFHHVPLVPNEDYDAAPLLVMSGVAAALVAAGFVGFRRRDVTS